MTKQQKELIITGILILVLIVVALTTLKPRKKPVAEPVTAAAPAVTVPAVTAAAPASTGAAALNVAPAQSVVATPDDLKKQRERAQLPWLLDPFYHMASDANITPDNLALKGISIGRNRKRYVFINNDIFTVDEVIPGGYKIMEIEKDRVLLRRGSERFYVPMPQD